MITLPNISGVIEVLTIKGSKNDPTFPISTPPEELTINFPVPFKRNTLI